MEVLVGWSPLQPTSFRHYQFVHSSKPSLTHLIHRHTLSHYHTLSYTLLHLFWFKIFWMISHFKPAKISHRFLETPSGLYDWKTFLNVRYENTTISSVLEQFNYHIVFITDNSQTIRVFGFQEALVIVFSYFSLNFFFFWIFSHFDLFCDSCITIEILSNSIFSFTAAFVTSFLFLFLSSVYRIETSHCVYEFNWPSGNCWRFRSLWKWTTYVHCDLSPTLGNQFSKP